jgi:hypothetical protein
LTENTLSSVKLSQVLVLTTDSRALSSIIEEDIVRKLVASGKPTVVAVAVHDADTIEYQQDIVGRVKAKLADLLPSKASLPPVVSVRKVGGETVNSDALETELLALFKDPETVREMNNAHSIKLALTSEDARIMQSIKLIDDIETKLNAIIEQHKQSNDAILNDFKNSDIAVAQEGIINLSMALQEYFSRLSFWKIVMNDAIADDLRRILSDHSLIKAEYQVSVIDVDGLCYWKSECYGFESAPNY